MTQFSAYNYLRGLACCWCHQHTAKFAIVSARYHCAIVVHDQDYYSYLCNLNKALCIPTIAIRKQKLTMGYCQSYETGLLMQWNMSPTFPPPHDCTNGNVAIQFLIVVHMFVFYLDVATCVSILQWTPNTNCSKVLCCTTYQNNYFKESWSYHGHKYKHYIRLRSILRQTLHYPLGLSTTNHQIKRCFFSSSSSFIYCIIIFIIQYLCNCFCLLRSLHDRWA